MWLLTAGPTREYLDDVRFLSNASSGRTGYAFAAEAARRGREVVLVSGPVELGAPPGVETVRVTSAVEMLDACEDLLAARRCEALIGVAAVCDFRPARRRSGKPPKEHGGFSIDFVENPDVLGTLAGRGKAATAVGFAVESLADGLDAALDRARSKLERKHLSAIVLNGIEAIGAARSRTWWVPREGEFEELGDFLKDALAAQLVERVGRLCPRNP